MHHVVGINYVSDSALSAILTKLRDEHVPVTCTSRRALKRKLDDSMQPAIYGPVMHTIRLPLQTGTCFVWVCPHVPSLLNHLAREPQFATLLKEKLLEHPCTQSRPWRLIYYFNEAICGNLLRRGPSRKSWIIYISFVEFGAELLSREAAWLDGGVLREQTCREVDGGFSTAMYLHMQQLLGASSTTSMSRGITILSDMGTFTLWARLGFTVGDEAALKMFGGSRAALASALAAYALASSMRGFWNPPDRW